MKKLALIASLAIVYLHPSGTFAATLESDYDIWKSGTFDEVTVKQYGTDTVFVGTKDGTDTVMNWDSAEQYDRISLKPIYSADKKSVAYFAEKNGKTYLIRDGIQSEKSYDQPYDTISDAVLSPNGKGIAFIV